MNHFYTISLFTLIAATQLTSLCTMKRTLESDELQHDVPTAQEQEKSIIELFCCLHNEIPIDLYPLIIKPIILFHADCSFQNNLDLTNPGTLCNSLMSICESLPKLEYCILSDQDLGSLLTAHLAQHHTSLLTLVNPSKETVLHCAAKTENILPRIIRIICMAAGADAQKLVMMQDNGKMTALIRAIWKGHTAFVLALLSPPGVDAFLRAMMQNNDGNTALHFAVLNDPTVFVQTLLSASGVNAPQLVMMQNNAGFTALHVAAGAGQIAAVRALLFAPGVDVHLFVMMQTNRGQTALFLAQREGHNDIVALLKPYMNQNQDNQ